MVRFPAGWAGTIARYAAGSGPLVDPQIRRPHVTDIQQYNNLVTVDLGNDGVAPAALFTASGAAFAFCGPAGLGESWSLDQCYLSTSVGAFDAALCTVYVGPFMSAGGAVAQYAVTSSIAGGGTQFGLGGIGLEDGWYVQAFWTGGTPGARAVLRVTGRKTVQAGPYGW